MSLRDDLAGVLARDSRYTIQAYAFVFEALEHTKQLRRAARAKDRARRSRATKPSGHVTGRELCLGLRDLALKQYGLLTMTVLAQWGIRATSDVGEIVYNLIASGDFEKTPGDARSDFDAVFEFDDAFRRSYVMPLDDVA
jgi:uncharacterized repeat protein (TIGR04138 family)